MGFHVLGEVDERLRVRELTSIIIKDNVKRLTLQSRGECAGISSVGDDLGSAAVAFLEMLVGLAGDLQGWVADRLRPAVENNDVCAAVGQLVDQVQAGEAGTADDQGTLSGERLGRGGWCDRGGWRGVGGDADANVWGGFGGGGEDCRGAGGQEGGADR